MEHGIKNQSSYIPVVALFATAALLALATYGGLREFMGFSLVLLALLKLMDLPAFVSTFQKYDLMTPAFPLYARLYPFIELGVGLGFLSGTAPTLTGCLSALVGAIGSFSVFKAVYVDKRDLNCACVGGNSRVPLGFVSLTENLLMVGMGLSTLVLTL